MGLKNFAKKLLKKAAPVAMTAASFTPAGRVAKIAKAGAALVKGSKVAKVASVAVGVGAVAGGARMLFGGKKKRRSFKGISSREMMELMKLQMVVGKKSMPYQMAVMKAVFGKLK